MGEGGSREKPLLARPACPILVAYVEPKRVFLDFLAEKFPVQPLVLAD